MTVEKGHRLLATVMSIKGKCNAGHNVGDTIGVSARSSGGLCGYLYHSAFPYILMLQFGGTFPWGERDVIELDCPDKGNVVCIRLRRIKQLHDEDNKK